MGEVDGPPMMINETTAPAATASPQTSVGNLDCRGPLCSLDYGLVDPRPFLGILFLCLDESTRREET